MPLSVEKEEMSRRCEEVHGSWWEAAGAAAILKRQQRLELDCSASALAGLNFDHLEEAAIKNSACAEPDVCHF